MICCFCGQSNGCELNKKETCWCEKIYIQTSLIKKIPKKEQGKSCICRKCIEKSHNSA